MILLEIKSLSRYASLILYLSFIILQSDVVDGILLLQLLILAEWNLYTKYNIKTLSSESRYMMSQMQLYFDLIRACTFAQPWVYKGQDTVWNQDSTVEKK